MSTSHGYENARSPDVEDRKWNYERHQEFYAHDLDLFNSRMSLFLTLNAALVALDLSKLAPAFRSGIPAALAGLIFSIAWYGVAESAYFWIKRLRAGMLQAAEELRRAVAVDTPARQAFVNNDAGRPAVKYFRPTTVSVRVVPFVFVVYWIYALTQS